RPSRAAERRRLREEVAIRKRKTSLLAGTLGLALVFAGGIGVIVSPQSALALIVAMGAGIVLLLVAFLLLRGPMTALSRKAPKWPRPGSIRFTRVARGRDEGRLSPFWASGLGRPRNSSEWSSCPIPPSRYEVTCLPSRA